MRFPAAAALLSLTLLAALLAALPATAATTAATTLAPVAGEVIVQFRPGAAVTRTHAMPARAAAGTVRDVLARRAAAMGTRLGRKIDAGSAVGERTQVLSASGMSATELAAKLAADPDVEFAVPNGRARRTTAPNDPLYALSMAELRSNGVSTQRGPASGQWYLRAPAATLAAGPVSSIDIEAAWARTRGSAGIVVAVLDTGVRPEHPDLSGRLLPGYDFVSNSTVANDGDGRDAVQTWLTNHFKVHPDTRSEISDLTQNGPYFSFRERATWTAPDGTRRTQHSLATAEIRDSLIARIWYFPTVKDPAPATK